MPVKTPSRPARRHRVAPHVVARDLMPTLANLYQSVIAEPIPDDILSLLDQLDKKPQ